MGMDRPGLVTSSVTTCVRLQAGDFSWEIPVEPSPVGLGQVMAFSRGCSQNPLGDLRPSMPGHTPEQVNQNPPGCAQASGDLPGTGGTVPGAPDNSGARVKLDPIC